MPLRKHQSQFANIIAAKINGTEQDFSTVVLRATPGSGKSAIPAQAAKLLSAGLAERLCWVVPRDALRTQGERNFLDPFFRRLLGHDFLVRAAINELHPCRGTHGFVTTYQAIGNDANSVTYQEFCQHKYVLILDEFHHCELNGAWAEKIQPLVDQAAFLVLMTGTLERGDNKPIAFLPYKKSRVKGHIEHKPDLDREGLRYIEYTRADALAEQAIIPMQFYCYDGSAEYDYKDERVQIFSIANALPSDIGAALYTALRTDYARELLAGAVNHWKQWRKKIRTAKLLVVCADLGTAQEATRQIRKLTSLSSDIATSHSSVAAKMAIDKFKRGNIKVLVTIAMAYEGLDVPEISHIACLTHIRSIPWIEQMIARAVRIDRAYRYRGQVAHIYAPDDPLFRKIVDRIENEQLPTIDNYDPGRRMEEQVQLTLFDEESTEEAAEPKVTPIGSRVTGQREWWYGEPVEPESGGRPEPITPREREQQLRQEIEINVRRHCYLNRKQQYWVNSEIKEHFGKSRQNMTAAELAAALDFVQKKYPGHQTTGRWVETCHEKRRRC